ncbi:MAG TPA: hypothetical protein VKU90_01570 [Caulobacteraceae bacterium]|nr:hypothetical protein [Caulobacteraceae bacterium]
MSTNAMDPHQPGDGADLSVTEARAGERRGVSRILVRSTLIGVAALFAAWVIAPHLVGTGPAAKPQALSTLAR